MSGFEPQTVFKPSQKFDNARRQKYANDEAAAAAAAAAAPSASADPADIIIGVAHAIRYYDNTVFSAIYVDTPYSLYLSAGEKISEAIANLPGKNDAQWGHDVKRNNYYEYGMYGILAVRAAIKAGGASAIAVIRTIKEIMDKGKDVFKNSNSVEKYIAIQAVSAAVTVFYNNHTRVYNEYLKIHEGDFERAGNAANLYVGYTSNVMAGTEKQKITQLKNATDVANAAVAAAAAAANTATNVAADNPNAAAAAAAEWDTHSNQYISMIDWHGVMKQFDSRGVMTQFDSRGNMRKGGSKTKRQRKQRQRNQKSKRKKN
jgi:hypothetical protein